MMKSTVQHWMISIPQTFCWKGLYSMLSGLHTSMLPLPCIFRQVCDMTKMETLLWAWFLGVSNCMAFHKSSPCSFPWQSCVLLSQVMQIMWWKKSNTIALWQGQSTCFSLERIWEKRLESNKLRTLWWTLPNCVWRAYDKWIAGDHLIRTVLTGWMQSTNLLLFEVLRQRVKLPILCRWCHIIGRHTWIDKGSLASLENCFRFPVNVLKIKWLYLEKGKCTKCWNGAEVT